MTVSNLWFDLCHPRWTFTREVALIHCKRTGQKLVPLVSPSTNYNITTRSVDEAFNDVRRAQAIRDTSRPPEDTFRIGLGGLFLGNRKWERGMRYPGTNELISAAIRYGRESADE